MAAEVEVRAMRAAIAASERVRGTTSPNPPVGCVILDARGEVAGVGATSPPGGPHAEVNALREAGNRAEGGTAVVTLEPCAHTGRTPPCADALQAAGVVRVVHAAADPNPSASGGAEVLRAAGIDVHSGLLADEVAKGPLRAWLHFVHTGRPHVTWKYAATLDGRSAAADGTSKWISSAQSRAEVHRVRAAMDAIIAGTGTILADDAQLTARDPDGNLLDRQPLRVVIGDREIPPGARVLDDAAETLRLPGGDPAAALAELAGRGVVDVLLEGGPTLAGAFWEAGLVDRVLAYVAPALLGAGPAALGSAGVGSISQAWRLRIEETTMSGPDVRISAVPQD
ncbi:bifunctional diaminohydroxyphosphoribosylaminopyrimidine deaminase/5-amino-6-(5-phosphoribosylamino)uracil reductase RibD [Saccharopolyspora karakumensis]|uniref:Riboflavin biosynthesis protein RibD n=1 Tax=Saccharopolyspora karakumensis TaxID=2530386 RepID=A0A4R5BHZ6_9PSEU|nr:bifunctional diaminohydroxyphosphoribosylaminopyrimidine deaminase/5-amino-6-(5-phosphoribosylamino)uracil reductase RibD [Saccharopolyspora karakumensis]TDD84676.1 bifunctional diaminohydroxyphosphoribosylaminopyrimidine deaminase/5-amino-6-(5-phosphoribosylamino)uracil reductase RibD [Saccharopolyspora karakumensis]